MSSLLAARTRATVIRRGRAGPLIAIRSHQVLSAHPSQSCGAGGSGPDSVRELRPHFPGHPERRDGSRRSGLLCAAT
jgi:hypothetical protein